MGTSTATTSSSAGASTPAGAGLRALLLPSPSLGPLRESSVPGVTWEEVEGREALGRTIRGVGDDVVVVMLAVGTDDGLGALSELCREMGHVPVVAVSTGEGPDAESVRTAGAAGHLVLGEGVPGSLERILRSWVREHRLRAELRAERRRIDDLEERVEAERARAEGADARFRNTVERVADGIVIVDEAGTVLFANDAAANLFGRRTAELVGADFGYPLVAGESVEVDVLRRGGGDAVAELRVTGTSWEGQPASLVSIRDVTDHRAAEEQARRLIEEQARRRAAEAAAEENEFRAEASRLLTSSLDTTDILRRLASVVVPLLGDAAVVDVLVDRADLRERRFVGLAPDLDGDDLRSILEAPPVLPVPEALLDLVGGGRPVRLDAPEEDRLTFLLRSEPQAAALAELEPRSVLVVPLDVREAPFGVLTLCSLGRDPSRTDVVERLAEEVAERAVLAIDNARLLRAAELAGHAKTDFLNVISHELRTPLTAIMGYSGLLREGMGRPLSPNQMEYVQGIERSSRKLLRIIDQLLLFARTEVSREEAVFEQERLHEVLEDVALVMAPLAEDAGLSFRVVEPGELVTVRIDADKVRQILFHLVSNAIRFTPEGAVSLEGTLEEDVVVFRVRDTGIGIPEDRRERIFEPFTQAVPIKTREVGGTGIGLNVVRNLVRLMDGHVEVESEPGQGSVFTVRLPLPKAEHVDGERFGGGA